MVVLQQQHCLVFPQTRSPDWKKYQREVLENALLSSREKCGRKKIDIDGLKSIPFKKRGTTRPTAKYVEVLKSTLHHYTQFGDFKIVRSRARKKSAE